MSRERENIEKKEINRLAYLKLEEAKSEAGLTITLMYTFNN